MDKLIEEVNEEGKEKENSLRQELIPYIGPQSPSPKYPHNNNEQRIGGLWRKCKKDLMIRISGQKKGIKKRRKRKYVEARAEVQGTGDPYTVPQFPSPKVISSIFQI